MTDTNNSDDRTLPKKVKRKGEKKLKENSKKEI